MGQAVTAGEPIARVGTTGASTGCHLHYEVRVNDEKIDGEAQSRIAEPTRLN